VTVKSVAMRRVHLPGDRIVVIRLIEPDDVDGLVALYEGLSQDDRYRRFFSLFLPQRPFFEGMVVAAQRGGACLAAEVVDPSGTRRIVAEASYDLLPNGDGELAIVVDTLWRGWLGPYLLDALIELAATHGVRNLGADVLSSNRPMLALLRGRGYVVVPRDDFTTLHLVIGTTGRVASWPGQRTGPRVLIEGGWSAWRGPDAGGDDGLQVLACPGPTARQRRCPALDGDVCPLAASADVIVLVNPSGGQEWSTLRSAHPRLHPDIPVCVALRGGTGQAEVAETELGVGPDVDLIGVVEAVATAHAQRSVGVGVGGDRYHPVAGGSA
jgi:GNAT superfamily N-acetyltransferase